MKQLIYIVFIVLISIVFSTDNKEIYSLIESSAPSVLSAVLGGVLAAVAIVVGVLSTSSDQIKQEAAKNTSFDRFIVSLGKDIKILIGCLVLSVVLPLCRGISLPISVEMYGVSLGEYYPYLITSLEISVFVVGFLIIIEISDILISVLRVMMKLSGNTHNKSN